MTARTVYVETSIVSYLAGKPSRDLLTDEEQLPRYDLPLWRSEASWPTWP